MISVEKKVRRKKRRSDRRHVIYKLEVAGQSYIGLTVFERTEKRSALRRFQKHVSRAKRDGKKWGLCRAIRKHGSDAFTVSVVKTIRGKSAAHAFERKLILKLKPSLNTDIREAA